MELTPGEQKFIKIKEEIATQNQLHLYIFAALAIISIIVLLTVPFISWNKFNPDPWAAVGTVSIILFLKNQMVRSDAIIFTRILGKLQKKAES